MSIPTDGSGRILITDINPNGINDKEDLICQSELPANETGLGSWYFHPYWPSTLWHDHINNNYYYNRGWIENVYIDSEGHRVARLKRASDTAKEGVFTCHIPGDMNSPISVEIHYPSELRSRQHFF